MCQFMEQYINYNANRVTIFAIASVYLKSGEREIEKHVDDINVVKLYRNGFIKYLSNQ